MLALAAPGFAQYDTVAQYQQVLSGEWDDWHPPAMVALWSLVRHWGPGAAPLFFVQFGLYAVGVALWCAALWAGERRAAAWLMLLLGFSPLLLGWQLVVLKDAQMLGALVAASGLVGWHRLRSRRLPFWAVLIAMLLVGYATLVRSNAVFAAVPLAVLLLPLERWWVRLALIAGGSLLVIGITPTINGRIFHAEPTGVANSLPVYSLAAIADRTPASAVSLFSPEERQVIAAKHCVKSFFWDSLGEPEMCGGVVERVQDLPTATLYAALAAAIVRHPLAYAEHRLSHWNMSERWLVPPGLILATPPDTSEPNEVGLATPGAAAQWFQLGPARVEAGTPLGWPIVWTLVALLLLPVVWRGRTAAERLALALAGSALGLEASFLLVSISSDLRYHLWPMFAAALALLLAAPGIRRGQWLGGAAAVLLLVGAGLASRWSLPRAPDSYHSELTSPRA
ncbi:hypothetical protein [Sphingomonas ginkgonis]|uniref:hypothetical protein n=1 Tax=Sphingomonas ginkgonis TaxID=2315330 RepID=UPI001EEF9D04|nr:hypothetical protein [Sphingomonas ginkgonis]